MLESAIDRDQGVGMQATANRPPSKMMAVDDVLAMLASLAPRPRVEVVSLDDADGRVLADRIRARRASPAAAVSAMDGYAVREEDVARMPARLRIVGRSFAGAGFDEALAPGECARVFTGARVPRNADRVIMQEDVCAEGDCISVRTRPSGKRHIRAAGCDFALGAMVARAGVRLTPQSLIAVAAADTPTVSVFARPRVTLVGTGDELVPPGQAARRADSIPESVTLGVAALVRRWGGEVTRRALVCDELGALRAAADAALADSDIVVTVGGASVGERDHAKAMFSQAGLEVIVPKVAVRPGKPIWIGRAGGKLIVGLPGNPSAAFITARLFLAPLVAAAAGGAVGDALRWRRAALAEALPLGDERETFLKAHATTNGMALSDSQDSSGQASLAASDALIRRRAGAPAVRAGELVDVLDL
jgi:molybdopterin molybdotransferase